MDVDVVRMGARFAAAAVKRAQTSCQRAAAQHASATTSGGSFLMRVRGEVPNEDENGNAMPAPHRALRRRAVDIWISSAVADVDADVAARHRALGAAQTFCEGSKGMDAGVDFFECGEGRVAAYASFFDLHFAHYTGLFTCFLSFILCTSNRRSIELC